MFFFFINSLFIVRVSATLHLKILLLLLFFVVLSPFWFYLIHVEIKHTHIRTKWSQNTLLLIWRLHSWLAARWAGAPRGKVQSEVTWPGAACRGELPDNRSLQPGIRCGVNVNRWSVEPDPRQEKQQQSQRSLMKILTTPGESDADYWLVCAQLCQHIIIIFFRGARSGCGKRIGQPVL